MPRPYTRKDPTQNLRSVTPRERREPLDHEERDARAAAMMARRLSGDYKTEIAAKFQLTVAEVNQELDYAKRRALHTKAVDFITLTLMPKALAVYAAALDEGNVEVATKVLEGLGIIGAKAQAGGVNILVGGGDGGGESYEQFRIKIARGIQGEAIEAEGSRGPAPRSGGGAEDQPRAPVEVIEADVVQGAREGDVE